MSYSSFSTIPIGSTSDKAREIILDSPVVGNEDCQGERDAQVHFGKVVAADLIESGCLGAPADTAWEVIVSGHANPDNVLKPEFSAGQVHIHVSQKHPEPTHEINAGESGGGKS